MTNMVAVIPSTNRESPKMELAGVETGAKMLVGLSAGSVAFAKGATASQRRTRTIGCVSLKEPFVAFDASIRQES
jgi:hypothetical protein